MTVGSPGLCIFAYSIILMQIYVLNPIYWQAMTPLASVVHKCIHSNMPITYMGVRPGYDANIFLWIFLLPK